MKNIISAILLVVVSAGCLTSCKKDSFDPGKTIGVKAANGWWVTATVGGADVGVGHFFLTTYNDAAQDDSMWVDDNEHFWQFKVKAKIDYNALTFATPLSANQYYTSGVMIANGKILLKAGHSRSGVITDSIYMETKFSDDNTPYGTTYVISGTARTGLVEDDY